jgi:H+-translocating NAD(P) transhydrogenase subunit beta
MNLLLAITELPGGVGGVRYGIYLGALFVASVLFILGLRGLTNPETARRGMMMAAVGMLIAVVGALLHRRIVSFEWIAGGLVLGTIIGIPMGLWIPMTKMPERIALSHAFGGLAVALVGVAEYYTEMAKIAATPGLTMGSFAAGAGGFEVLLGSVTFTGSLMAFGKLQGILSGRPQTYPGQNAVNYLLIAASVVLIGILVAKPDFQVLFYVLSGLGLLLGVLLVVPIGGRSEERRVGKECTG